MPDLVELLAPAELVARHAEVLAHLLGPDLDVDLALLVLDDLARHLAAHAGDLALQAAHAGFLGEAAHDLEDALLGEVEVLGREPVLLELLGDQEAPGDLELLLLGVARGSG